MKTEKGFLLFYDWVDALDMLSPKDFKRLLLALIEYQKNGTEPPEFSNKAKTIASLIFPQIDRRKYLAEMGKKGAEIRYKDAAIDKPADSEANGEAIRVANRVADRVPSAIDKDRDKDQTKSQSKTESETESKAEKENTATTASAVAVTIGSADVTIGSADASIGFADAEHAHGERKEDSFYEKNAATGGDRKVGEAASSISSNGRGRGKFGNVYLTEREYRDICRNIPNADGYIERFSEKMWLKGYRYPSHFKAIMDWWKEDEAYEKAPPPPEKPRNSFGDDEFFKAAFQRTLSEGGLSGDALNNAMKGI